MFTYLFSIRVYLSSLSYYMLWMNIYCKVIVYDDLNWKFIFVQKLHVCYKLSLSYWLL